MSSSVRTRAGKEPAGGCGGLWTVLPQLLGSKYLYSYDGYEFRVFPVVLICYASSACNVKYPRVGLNNCESYTFLCQVIQVFVRHYFHILVVPSYLLSFKPAKNARK